MKKKYLVYGIRSSNDKYEIIKTFKNELDAIYFVASDKNVFQYGDMILKCRDCDGAEHTWNDSKRMWEAA